MAAEPDVPDQDEIASLKAELDLAVSRHETAQKALAEVQINVKEWSERRATSKWVGGASIIVICCIAAAAWRTLPDIINGPPAWMKSAIEADHAVAERYLWISLAAHAVLTIALVWFGYQLLRAAERLAIPFNVVTSARDLTGVAAPSEGAYASAVKLISLVRGSAPPES